MGDMELWLTLCVFLLAISNVLVVWKYRYRPLLRQKKLLREKSGAAAPSPASSR